MAFKDDEFIVLDCHNRIVLVDKILNYDLSFESQKKFILNVLNKIFKYVKDEDNMDCEIIMADCEERKCRIVGEREFMYAKYYVEIVGGKLKICKKFKYYDDCLDEIFKKIAANLDDSKVEVFYYDNCLDFEGFYINVIVDDNIVTVNYVDDDEYYKLNSLKNVLKENKITVY